MSTFSLGSLQLAVGLDWFLASDRAELRAIGARKPRASRVRMRCAEGFLLGLGNHRGAWNRQLHAGALLIAQRCAEALVYQPLQEGHRVWFCAVRGGLPLPGCDQVCSPEEAQHRINEVLALAPGTPLVGEHPDAQKPLAAVLDKASQSALRLTRLRRPHGAMLAVLTAALALAAGTCAFAFLREPEPVAFVPPPRAAAQPDVDQARLRSGFDEQVATLRQEQLGRPALAALGDSWLNIFASLPPSIGGFHPEQASCDAKHCDITWAAANIAGTNAAGLPGQVLVGSEDSKRKTRIALPPLAEQMQATVSAAELAGYRSLLAPRLRLAGTRAEFGTLGNPLVVKPPTALRDAAPFVLGRSASLRINVSGWANVRSALNMLTATPFVTRRALLTLDKGRIALQLEGHYVVTEE